MTDQTQPAADTAQRVAAYGLLGALVAEANEWATEEDSGILERLIAAPWGDVLPILGSTTLVPTHLYVAIREAVARLAPDLAG